MFGFVFAGFPWFQSLTNCGLSRMRLWVRDISRMINISAPGEGRTPVAAAPGEFFRGRFGSVPLGKWAFSIIFGVAQASGLLFRASRPKP